MSKPKSRLRGCFKYGCFGCLGSLGLLVLFGVAIALIQATGGDPRRESRDLAQELPERETMTPEEFDRARAAGEFDAAGGAPGTVSIRLRGGRFFVEPGPPDEPIHVEAEYDVKAYRLDQKFEDHGEKGWSYRLDFGPRGLFAMLRQNHGSEQRLKLVIPRGTPIRLEGVISMGESDVELGGLWLVDTSLDLGMGDHTIGFDEPLAMPTSGLRLHGSMGALQVRRVGNASPRVVDVRHSMGELSLDLRGEWHNDADVVASCSMGECSVVVPRDVRIDLRKASIALGEKSVSGVHDMPDAPPGTPTIGLSVRHTMGELRIDG